VFWLFILGLCAVVIGVGFSAIGIFGMLASVAVIFYLVDVRPKVKEITGRRY
jgi:preprotein translocase subunit Sss1